MRRAMWRRFIVRGIRRSLRHSIGPRHHMAARVVFPLRIPGRRRVRRGGSWPVVLHPPRRPCCIGMTARCTRRVFLSAARRSGQKMQPAPYPRIRDRAPVYDAPRLERLCAEMIDIAVPGTCRIISKLSRPAPGSTATLSMCPAGGIKPPEESMRFPPRRAPASWKPSASTGDAARRPITGKSGRTAAGLAFS